MCHIHKGILYSSENDEIMNLKHKVLIITRVSIVHISPHILLVYVPKCVKRKGG